MWACVHCPCLQSSPVFALPEVEIRAKWDWVLAGGFCLCNVSSGPHVSVLYYYVRWTKVTDFALFLDGASDLQGCFWICLPASPPGVH